MFVIGCEEISYESAADQFPTSNDMINSAFSSSVGGLFSLVFSVEAYFHVPA